MKKLMMTGILLLCVMVGVWSQIVSKEAAGYIHRGEKSLYPGIIHVFLNDSARYKNAVFTNINAVDNVYVIENVGNNDGLNLVQFTLTITMDASGVLTYELSNLMSKTVKERDYKPVKAFSFLFDKRNITNPFNVMLPQVFSGESAYAAAKQKADELISSKYSRIAKMPLDPSVALGRAGAANVNMPCSFNQKLVYPAFYQALEKLRDKIPGLTYAQIKSIDCVGNSITLTKMVAVRTDLPEMYDLLITARDNELQFEILQFKNFDAATLFAGNKSGGNFLERSNAVVDSVPDLNLASIAKPFTEEVSMIVQSAEGYNTAKSTFLSNPLNMFLSVKDVTEILFDDYLQEIKDTPVQCVLKVSGAKKNQGKEYTNYSYVITSWIIDELSTRIIGEVNVYTNNKSLAASPKDSQITVKGKLDGYKKRSIENTQECFIVLSE